MSDLRDVPSIGSIVMVWVTSLLEVELSLFIGVCVCVCLCVCVCMCVYVRVYTYIYIYIYLCVSVLNFLSYLLTPWSTVLLEKLTGFCS